MDQHISRAQVRKELVASPPPLVGTWHGTYPDCNRRYAQATPIRIQATNTSVRGPPGTSPATSITVQGSSLALETLTALAEALRVVSLPLGSGRHGRSSRVRSAAQSQLSQPQGAGEARGGAAKTAPRIATGRHSLRPSAARPCAVGVRSVTSTAGSASAGAAHQAGPTLGAIVVKGAAAVLAGTTSRAEVPAWVRALKSVDLPEKQRGLQPGGAEGGGCSLGAQSAVWTHGAAGVERASTHPLTVCPQVPPGSATRLVARCSYPHRPRRPARPAGPRGQVYRHSPRPRP